MVDWAKKITKTVGGDIDADEQVEAGLFVQPSGTTRGMMSLQIGGLVGKALADRLGGKGGEGAELVRDQGIAATIPANERLVLGLTSRRLLVWGHAQLSGKPKGLKATVPLSSVAAIEAEKQKLTHTLVLAFDDGSGLVVEAPKIGNPEDFVATFQRLKG